MEDCGVWWCECGWVGGWGVARLWGGWWGVVRVVGRVSGWLAGWLADPINMDGCMLDIHPSASAFIQPQTRLRVPLGHVDEAPPDGSGGEGGVEEGGGL